MRRRDLWFLLPVVLAGSVALAWQETAVNDGTAHGDAPYLLEPGWTPLISPKSLGAWQYEHPEKGTWTNSRAVFWDSVNQPKQLLALPGPGDRIANGPKGGNSNIYTKQKFGDMELYVEFLIPANSNSGVYLHGLYEVQVYDSFGVEHPKYLDCGAIYERWINNKGEGGTPPVVNASRRPGEWQSFHIWFRGPRFDTGGRKISNATFVRVLHNGLLVHENVEAPGPTRSGLEIPEAATNPLMLQGDHGPVAYRNIYWRPLRPLSPR
ncbi:MAG: DUF1080 domain-containing protein [Acidobacteriota bacterium]|nr:DUF1080 domain-containing protein [Acidobacteriota bacterium]